ncbi:MAG: hypothetical protein H6657_22205 [Ardenticatenaceae bacterium]|nr:hypothetical protein [Ardenticatenaceae bacterium]
MNYLLTATIFLTEGATEPVGVPPWIPVVIGIILLLVFLWGLNRNNIPQGEPAHADDHHDAGHSDAHAHHEPEAHVESVAERSTAVPIAEAVAPDDLKIIEGIGPKIEGILHEAGIFTFAALAAASVDHLEQIVREDAGIRVAFPDTWPEQARLAASGEWTALETLQDELKGGRRA